MTHGETETDAFGMRAVPVEMIQLVRQVERTRNARGSDTD